MDVIILTGLSGSGKSIAANALEDIGYYCIENVPPKFVEKFAEFCMQSGGAISKLAIVTDIRGGKSVVEIENISDKLRSVGLKCKTVFLDASDSVLIKRYKETRRKHPLLSDEDPVSSLADAVKRERELLKSVREHSDIVFDTSLLSSKQLMERLKDTFSDSSSSNFITTCTSFGYKYGIPEDADLVFDVRYLPNPFYLKELKEKNGLDKEVVEYVFKWEQSKELLKRLTDFIDYLIPFYIDEGKGQLTIAIGCTGGKHRSVAFAEKLAAHIREQRIKTVINHRDILKNTV
ncbi:MAG: RNase adapter RapZ [Oscillospiraceae bacterium]|nr:RNase adapter RapZ [Oscillospiraceae bacterium]